MGLKYHVINDINIQRGKNCVSLIKTNLFFPKVSNHSIIAEKWSKTLRTCLFLPGMKRSRPRLRDQASPHPAMLRSTVITDSACKGWRGGWEKRAEWGRVVWGWERQTELLVSFGKPFFSPPMCEENQCPAPHHASLHFHACKRGARNYFVGDDLGKWGRLWWYFTVFLCFWGGFQWFLCELQGDIDWDGAGGGGGPRRYKLPHWHQSNLAGHGQMLGMRSFNCNRGRNTLHPTGIKRAAVEPAGGQQGFARGWHILLNISYHNLFTSFWIINLAEVTNTSTYFVSAHTLPQRQSVFESTAPNQAAI